VRIEAEMTPGEHADYSCVAGRPSPTLGDCRARNWDTGCLFAFHDALMLPAKPVVGRGQIPGRLELRYQLYFRLIELASKIADRIIPGAIAILIVYFGNLQDGARNWRAKQTLAGLGINLLADVRPDEIISYAAAICWMDIRCQRSTS